MLFPLERGHGKSSFSRCLYISASLHLNEVYGIFGVAVWVSEDKAWVRFSYSLSSLIHLADILDKGTLVVLSLKQLLYGGTWH